MNIEIAKNLLLNHSCNNCSYLYIPYIKLCSYHFNRSGKLPQQLICSHWRSKNE